MRRRKTQVRPQQRKTPVPRKVQAPPRRREKLDVSGPTVTVIRNNVPSVQLITCVPYSPDGDLGAAYNRAMQAAPDGSWVCFLDHDAAFTTKYWYGQIARAIAAVSRRKVGLFTAVTNRIANPYQRLASAPRDHDIAKHRKFGLQLLSRHGDEQVDVTNREPVSGVVLILSRAAWQSVGPLPSGFLGVDNELHALLRAQGFRVVLLPGLYVYHWYRGDGDKSHLSVHRRVEAPKRWW